MYKILILDTKELVTSQTLVNSIKIQFKLNLFDMIEINLMLWCKWFQWIALMIETRVL